VRVTNIAIGTRKVRARAVAWLRARLVARDVEAGDFAGSIHTQERNMKSMKILSLVLLATSLASGAVYARGGGGMGGGSASSADHSQQQTQERTQKRTQKRDGSQSGDAQHNEYRYENREQMRSENTLPSMQ
jgi:hypothetical protein